jgi:hypothetical protein
MLTKLRRRIQNNTPWWWPTEDRREFCGEQIIVNEQVYECEVDPMDHDYRHISRTGFRWAA